VTRRCSSTRSPATSSARSRPSPCPAPNTPATGRTAKPRPPSASRNCCASGPMKRLLPMRLLQTERNAVLLGDGVYLLHWDGDKQRVRIDLRPGFYFPVLDEDSDGSDFPDRVHFAWELPEDKPRGLPARLRRITYHLDWIRPATTSAVDRTSRPVRAPVMSEAPADEPPAALSSAAATSSTPPVRSPASTRGPRSRRTRRLPHRRRLGPRRSEGARRRRLTCPWTRRTSPPTRRAKSSTAWTCTSTSCRSSTSPTPCPRPASTGDSRRWPRCCRCSMSCRPPTPTPARASATTGSPILGISGKAVNEQHQYSVGPGGPSPSARAAP
jgi:hypothetical protein